MRRPFLIGGGKFCTKRGTSSRCVLGKDGETADDSCEINPKTGRCRKRQRTTEEKQRAYRADPFLNAKKQSWCRCVLHVAKKQDNSCLKYRQFREKKCYSPYAICSKSTTTSTGGKPCKYDFLTVPDLEEVEKYLYLNFKAYETFCKETGREMFPEELRESADAFYHRNDKPATAPPTPERPPKKKKVAEGDAADERTKWFLDEQMNDVETAKGASFILQDVRGDGNCFHYALLRATKSKGLAPGKKFKFDPDAQKFTKRTKLLVPPRTETTALKKLFTTAKIKEAKKSCQSFNDNFEIAGLTVKAFSDNMTKNKEYIEYVPGVHDLLLNCLFGVKLRVYHDGLKQWLGEYAEEPATADDVVNLLFEPETEENDGHYMWLKPATGNEKDNNLLPPSFSPAQKFDCEGYWSLEWDDEKYLPIVSEEAWEGKGSFVDTVEAIEEGLRQTGQYKQFKGYSNTRLPHLIDAPREMWREFVVGSGEFFDDFKGSNICWPEGYVKHYIDRFNVMPTQRFYNYVRWKGAQDTKRKKAPATPKKKKAPATPKKKKKKAPATAPATTKKAPKKEKARLPKGFKPMLAESLGTVRDGKLVKKKKIDVRGYFASEKFDGYRAIWTGSNFTSRNGNTFEVPDWMKRLMPTQPLDGELFRGRCNYEACGLFRRKNVTDKDWMDVKYMVFDLPVMDAPFEERMEALEALVDERCDRAVDVAVPKGIRTVGCPLVFATQTKVRDETDAVQLFNEVVAKGGEGIMLRKPGSFYSNRRTKDLLKIKVEDDTECEIVGYKEYKDGTGENAGKLGSYHCALLEDKTKTFYVGIGLTNDDRKQENRLPIGTIITITYNDKTKNGIPRHPRFLRVRADADLSGGQRFRARSLKGGAAAAGSSVTLTRQQGSLYDVKVVAVDSKKTHFVDFQMDICDESVASIVKEMREASNKTLKQTLSAFPGLCRALKDEIKKIPVAPRRVGRFKVLCVSQECALAGGEKAEEVQFLEREYAGTFLKTGTEGSTYKNEDGTFYVKFLTQRQAEYYQDNEAILEQYHAPYTLKTKGKKRLEMPAFGDPVRSKEGLKYAIDALRTLHEHNVYHGDIFSSRRGRADAINQGNILQNKSTKEYRLIDFGPLDDETRSDEDLLVAEKEFLTKADAIVGSQRPTPKSNKKKRRPGGLTGKRLFV